jgi:hypothetical protein
VKRIESIDATGEDSVDDILGGVEAAVEHEVFDGIEIPASDIMLVLLSRSSTASSPSRRMLILDSLPA